MCFLCFEHVLRPVTLSASLSLSLHPPPPSRTNSTQTDGNLSFYLRTRMLKSYKVGPRITQDAYQNKNGTMYTSRTTQQSQLSLWHNPFCVSHKQMLSFDVYIDVYT